MSNNKDFKVKNGIQPTVYHEGLGTVVSGSVGYNLAGASYDSVSFSVTGQSTAPLSLVFNSSGTRFFLLQSNGSVYQYSLSTAWDLSTASYDSVSFDPTGQVANPYALEFANSGSKMYIQDYYGAVYEYTLSTAFDLSTASYSSNNYDPTEITSQGYGIAFNPDGTKVYLLSATEDSVFQYSLSTAYNISTASYDSKSLSVASEDGTVYDITFNDTGTKLFVMGNVNDTVFQYNLTTAYDISTASYSSISFSLSSQENNPNALTFKPDGSKMYILGFTNDTIYQYSTALTTAQLDLSTGSVFDYTPTSDVQVTLSNPAASGTVSGATLLLEGAEATGVASTFSTTLYDGTGAAQTITNGIDLANDGGLVWVKGRPSGGYSHALFDSENNSFGSYLQSDNNNASTTLSHVTANSDGFSLSATGYAITNSSGIDYASWTFKKQSSFFDVVTYTGDGVAGREIAHNLGSTPAVIITKNLNDTENWQVYHKDLGNDQRILLNQTAASGSAPTHWNSTTPTDTVFTVGTHNGTNGSGDGIVAYLFAHDTDASSLIKCGSYTGNGSNTGPVINLGWEPQWLMFKNASASVRETVACDWMIFDNVRGIEPSPSKKLEPNTSDAEQGLGIGLNVTSTGFQIDDFNRVLNFSGDTFIYMAIRAENIPTITYDPTLEWPGGTAPTAPAKGETDVVTFNTRDGGSTYQGVLAIDGAK